MPRNQLRAAALLVAALCAAGVVIATRPPPRAPAHRDAALATGQPLAAGLLDGRRLDLNRATEDDLAVLPGIGPERARRIARHRARHGPFSSVDGLLDVPGIGPKTVERLRPLVGP